MPDTHPCRSCHHPVLVDQPTEPIGATEPAGIEFERGRGITVRRLRRTLAKRAVGPMGVLVLDILGEDRLQVTPAEDQHPIEAVSANGADYPPHRRRWHEEP